MLIDTLYAANEGLENPTEAFGGIQSVPDLSGSTIQSAMGENLGRIQEGIDGSQSFHGPDGQYEGYSQENIFGGKDYYDESGQLTMQTQEGVIGELILGADGSYNGMVTEDGMGGESLTDATGKEVFYGDSSMAGYEVDDSNFSSLSSDSSELLGDEEIFSGDSMGNIEELDSMGDFGGFDEWGEVGEVDAFSDFL